MSDYEKIHQPCPDCGSSNALSIYSDGHSYCFKCEKYTPRPELSAQHAYQRGAPSLETPLEKWEDRNISPAVMTFYDVEQDGQTIYFPYYDDTNKRVAKKVRKQGKNFTTDGSFSDCSMFGFHTLNKAVSERSKSVIVTEGEADALAAFQMANNINAMAKEMGTHHAIKYVPAFSVKTGAAGAVRDFKNHLEQLEKFDRVFICFDNDDPGKINSEKCAKLLSPGKAHVVELEYKDACEYTKRGFESGFLGHLKSARPYTPSGIQNGRDEFDRLWSEQEITSVPFPFPDLQEKTLGHRAREIVTYAAGTGVGKSSILRELQHYYLTKTDHTIGIIALEESVDRTRRGILAVEANDRLHLNEVFKDYSKEKIREYFDKTLGTGRVYLYDHFGSMEIEDLLNRVRYMVLGLDCKMIFIDHLSVIVSGLDIADERKAIDRTMTMLRQLTEETGCTIHLVTHLRRLNSDRSHEEGLEINLGHLRGSHGIAQISDTVIAMERDTQSDDPVVSNTTTLRVLKCRYTGDVGMAGKLYYDKQTGRMEPVNEEF
jgi:twinkle protein